VHRCPRRRSHRRVESTIGRNANECGNAGLCDAERAIVDRLEEIGLVEIKGVEGIERRRVWLELGCHGRKRGYEKDCVSADYVVSTRLPRRIE
jgi:hypothetical protein